MENIFKVLFLSAMFMFTACSTTSTFRIENDKNRDDVFQYCGGQQWGYEQKLGSENGAPYQVILLNSGQNGTKDNLSISFIIQTKADLHLLFKTRNFQVLIDDKVVFDKSAEFWILKPALPISERYHSNYYDYKMVPGKNNEWFVFKKKYGGLFGVLLLEDPFVVKIEDAPAKKVTSDKIEEALDIKNFSSIFAISGLRIPADAVTKDNVVITVTVPAFEVNGVTVQAQTFKINYDHNKLMEDSKDSRRCLTLEEILHFARIRNDGSLFKWMVPTVKD